MRITSKGQVTIPQEIREKMGFLPHTEIEFQVEGRRVVLRKARTKSVRGKDIVSRMRGKATVTMSTDQILSLTRG